MKSTLSLTSGSWHFPHLANMLPERRWDMLERAGRYDERAVILHVAMELSFEGHELLVQPLQLKPGVVVFYHS